MGIATLDTLLHLEREGWEPLCNRTEAACYGELITDDGRMVLFNGFIMDREAVVASLNDGLGRDGCEIADA